MPCEYRLLAVHVHGHEAEIEAFFGRLDEALDKVAEEATLLYPSLEIIDDEDEENE